MTSLLFFVVQTISLRVPTAKDSFSGITAVLPGFLKIEEISDRVKAIAD